jgi:hypothetical protein
MRCRLAILASLIALAALPAAAPAAPLRSVAAFSPITGSAIGVPKLSPRAIAVDETSGNIFVAKHPETIHILSAEGGVPTGIASPYAITGLDFDFSRLDVAVDNSATSPSKGMLYVVDKAGLHKYTRNAGTEQYEAVGDLSMPGNPMVVTVDDAGDVYVAVQEPFSNLRWIDKFSPTGTLLSHTELTGGAAQAISQEIRSIAVDSAGDVFVGDGLNRAFKFPANGLGELEPSNFVQFADSIGRIAIDRASNTLLVFRFQALTSPVRVGVNEFDATSLVEKGFFGSESIAGEGGPGVVGVNSAAGLSYASTSDTLSAFADGPPVPDVGTTSPSLKATKATLQGLVNPSGLAVTECKFEYGPTVGLGSSAPCAEALPADSTGHPVSAEVGGLNPNKGYFFRLVAKNANGANRTIEKRFTTEKIATTTAASAITLADATLNGLVRPEGAPLTACEFEYGLTAAYGTTVPCSPEAGAIPTDFEPHAVSADVGGLLVGTTYHYRVLATGATGTEGGGDLTFTTIGPSVNGRSVSAIGETSAKLEALINPRGKETGYHFEYGTQPCDSNPCTSAPVPDASAGAGGSDVAVSQLVKGLSPATTYHYRVVVSNPDGTGHSSEGTFTTFNVPQTFGPCANDALRSGHPSAALPDCRAYEQVSLVDKNGGDAGGQLFKVQASLSGDAITSHTQAGIPGAEGAQEYPIQLSRRAASEWATQGLFPPPSYGDQVRILTWTPDLAYSFSEAKLTGSDEVGELDAALLARSSLDRSVEVLVPYTDGAHYDFAAASADDSKILFEASGPGVNLTGNATSGKTNLYLFDRGSGELSLVGLLPLSEGGFAPPGGSFAGPFDWWSGTSPATLARGGGANGGGDGAHYYFTQEMGVISDDGTKAFFTAGETGRIYMREGIGGEEPETVQISASQRATPDPGGHKPAIFQRATPDGSIAYLTSCEKLTDDSTAHSTAANTCDTASQGQDLYAYDTATHQLSDLTVDDDPGGADVKGVVGAAEDGSVVYFVANGDLDGGGPATTGDCQHTGPAISYSGACSLYVWHEGATTFIARLDASGDFRETDAVDWQPNELTSEESQTLARVSADGQVVVFRSQRALSAYESEGTPAFYRYRFGDPAPTCVTCDPTGRPGGGNAQVMSINPLGNRTPIQPVLSRFVSAEGDRVFFETTAKLVGADTNGDQACPGFSSNLPGVFNCQDVYEWEAPGAGSCSAASPAFSSQDQGCIYLLSSGTSPYPSHLADASVSGEDVFIFTRDRLLPEDTDHQQDLYDVRAGGGLASQNQPPPPPPCEGGACRKEGSAPPSGQTAGTAGFQGPGDPPLRRAKKHHKHKHQKKRGGRGR